MNEFNDYDMENLCGVIKKEFELGCSGQDVESLTPPIETTSRGQSNLKRSALIKPHDGGWWEDSGSLGLLPSYKSNSSKDRFRSYERLNYESPNQLIANSVAAHDNHMAKIMQVQLSESEEKIERKKVKSPRTIMKLMAKHRDSERLRHHDLNAILKKLVNRVPGKLRLRETRVQELQKIIRYCTFLEQKVHELATELDVPMNMHLPFLTAEHEEDGMLVSPIKPRRMRSKPKLRVSKKSLKARRVTMPSHIIDPTTGIPMQLTSIEQVTMKPTTKSKIVETNSTSHIDVATGGLLDQETKGIGYQPSITSSRTMHAGGTGGDAHQKYMILQGSNNDGVLTFVPVSEASVPARRDADMADTSTPNYNNIVTLTNLLTPDGIKRTLSKLPTSKCASGQPACESAGGGMKMNSESFGTTEEELAVSYMLASELDHSDGGQELFTDMHGNNQEVYTRSHHLPDLPEALDLSLNSPLSKNKILVGTKTSRTEPGDIEGNRGSVMWSQPALTGHFNALPADDADQDARDISDGVQCEDSVLFPSSSLLFTGDVPVPGRRRMRTRKQGQPQKLSQKFKKNRSQVLSSHSVKYPARHLSSKTHVTSVKTPVSANTTLTSCLMCTPSPSVSATVASTKPVNHPQRYTPQKVECKQRSRLVFSPSIHCRDKSMMEVGGVKKVRPTKSAVVHVMGNAKEDVENCQLQSSHREGFLVKVGGMEEYKRMPLTTMNTAVRKETSLSTVEPILYEARIATKSEAVEDVLKPDVTSADHAYCMNGGTINSENDSGAACLMKADSDVISGSLQKEQEGITRCSVSSNCVSNQVTVGQHGQNSSRLDYRKETWMNGFMYFSKCNRKLFERKTGNCQRMSNVTKHLAQAWRAMNPDQKRPYELGAEAYFRK
ncbi:PREDICTED: uncharacterized protein LOC106806471 [Priapulus caudatus]|uniref:Uncharacterized protein LOC106806471 n=1 Tax=Priapulus caudatus TaxID=37621 RepID=A0ABM1DVE1_PRICU|nr:PREDICTED: uncharacterized protein LOC106806471 [Priapulus caudatus]